MKMSGKNPTMPVAKAEKSRGILLTSPGVQQAMIPETAISALTSSSATPTYHTMIFAFILQTKTPQSYFAGCHLSI